MTYTVMRQALGALEAHHAWQQEIGTVLVAEDGREPLEIDISEAYAEAGLCDRTMNAIAALRTALTPEDDAVSSGFYPKPAHGWTCFHCGETFTSIGSARDHFGMDPSGEPGCRIKLGEERGLLMELRKAQAELVRYRAEDSDKDRELHRMQAEHMRALRRAEELGYERGMRDVQSETLTFQARVQPWMAACFGPKISADILERNDRLIEEALELTQANGYTAERAHALVNYVFGRPVGEPEQEVGGVMVTLAALCLAAGLDMHAAAEMELARVWTKIDKIRAKQAGKFPGPAPQGSA